MPKPAHRRPSKRSQGLADDLEQAFAQLTWSLLKAAAVKRQNMTVQHFVITNELDGQRTDKILNQPCIDGLIMVHLPMAKELGTVTPMMEGAIGARRLLDLTDFVRLTSTWTV
jgi:hypothetical protein